MASVKILGGPPYQKLWMKVEIWLQPFVFYHFRRFICIYVFTLWCEDNLVTPNFMIRFGIIHLLSYDIYTGKGEDFFLLPLCGNAVCYSVYIFRTDWDFFIKFCSSDPSFNRNILRSLYLKFKTSAHVHIIITYYYVLFTNFLTWYEL